MELHYKCPDRGIGGMAEVPLQLLGGELLCAVGRQNIFPKQPFFLGDFSFRKGCLIYLKLCLRRHHIHLQTVIDFVAEVGQERRYIRVAGDKSILFDTVIGFVVG